jgi:hypothetical protein
LIGICCGHLSLSSPFRLVQPSSQGVLFPKDDNDEQVQAEKTNSLPWRPSLGLEPFSVEVL